MISSRGLSTPADSPDKVFTPLVVASPKSINLQIPSTTPDIQPLTIVESIEVDAFATPTIPDESAAPQNSSVTGIATPPQTATTPVTAALPEATEKGNGVESLKDDKAPSENLVVTPTNTMHRFDPALGHEGIEILADDATTQPPPFIFSQYLTPTLLDDATARTTSSLAGPVGYETAGSGFQGNIPENPMPGEFTGGISTNLNVTRQEILTLTRFLGRIPQSFISDEGDGAHQALSLTVVEGVTDPALLTTSSQEDQTGPSSSRTVSTELFADRPMVRRKRKRPKYSLTVSMLKKHPILKFSATGPLDADKTLYKWWCRVCRTELTLMSRGPLELISHYRTDSHLIKEHRIRMEVPGTPLFDKEGKEIQGVALLEAKKWPKIPTRLLRN